MGRPGRLWSPAAVEDAERCGDVRGVGDVAVRGVVVQRVGAVALVGAEEAVDLGDVNWPGRTTC